jgi:hypothetical protein
MKKHIILAAFLSAVCVDAQTTTNAPRTWFDAYKSTLEAPLIRGMASIGSLTGQVSYPVDIRVERLNVRPTTNTIYAVAMRTRLAGNVLQVDYIDYDELDGLIHGLQLISQSDHSVVPMDDFEVVYRVRSGLSVAKISNGNNIKIIIKCGDTNGTHNEIAPYILDNFQGLLSAAKSKIDAIIASGQ